MRGTQRYIRTRIVDVDAEGGIPRRLMNVGLASIVCILVISIVLLARHERKEYYEALESVVSGANASKYASSSSSSTTANTTSAATHYSTHYHNRVMMYWSSETYVICSAALMLILLIGAFVLVAKLFVAKLKRNQLPFGKHVSISNL